TRRTLVTGLARALNGDHPHPSAARDARRAAPRAAGGRGHAPRRCRRQPGAARIRPADADQRRESERGGAEALRARGGRRAPTRPLPPEGRHTRRRRRGTRRWTDPARRSLGGEPCRTARRRPAGDRAAPRTWRGRGATAARRRGRGRAPAAVAGATVPGAKVSLANATVEQLNALPGIGPVTAQKIVDWRTTHGPFRSVDDLDDIPGIGPARIEQLRDLVTPCRLERSHTTV